MATVHLPRSLVAMFPDAPRHLDVEADDMAALVTELDAHYPGMWDRLCEPGPQFREHINAFVDGHRVTIEASLTPASVVHIIPAVSGGAQAEAERVHAESVGEWHAWLAANHQRVDGVWLVSWKRRTGRPRIAYEEAVIEALAWGWIDSRAASLDDAREMLWYSPRRRGSDWSRSNKQRVARLEAEGRLMPAGRAAIEQAKADGSWTRLDEVEDLIVPADLGALLASRPGALERWEALSRTVRRQALAEIARAKRPETRQRRVEAAADLDAGLMLDRFKRKPQQPDKATAQAEREAGRAAYERGDDTAALAAFERSIDADPRSAWTWLFLAQAQLRLGDRDASYAAVRRALELKPDEPSASWHLIELLEADERPDEAKALTVALCEAHPEEPAILQRGTATLTRLEDRGAAVALADRVLTGQATDGERVAALAAGLDAGGATDEAAALMRARLPEGSLAATVGRASLLWWQGHPREAWDLVRDLRPAEVGSSLLVKLGRSLRAKGELEAAKDAYKAAASVDPEQGRAGYWADVVEGEWIRTSGRWHATPSKVVALKGVPGRVLHIVTRSRPWAQVGYSIRTQYVAKGQQAVGLEPHIATQYGFPLTIGVEDAPASHLVESVPHHHFLPADGQVPARADDRLTAGLESLATLLPEVRPAVLQAASDYQNALLALRLRELFDLPVVYEVRGFWEESWLARTDRDGGGDTYRWRQERDTECMARADAIVTLSEGMADEIVARGIDRAKITLVPNGVDVERFVPVTRDPELARRWGIAPDDVTLGYVSTLWPYEGIEYLLRAAALLVSRGLPVRVVIVGEGEAYAELQQVAVDLGIRDRVAFTGRVPHAEILSYYGLIDVFVVPRRDDRVSHLVTPLKPLEAMATGRALIVSGVAALRGMIEEGVTGEVFRPEDADDLARVAADLVRDPDRRTSLGRAARDWVVEHRSWDRLARSYADLYERLR